MKEKGLINHNESDRNKKKRRKMKGFETYKQEVYESIVRTQRAIKQELKSRQYVELESYTVSKIKKEVLEIVNRFLPDINGIQILQEIRQHKETKDIPVFILTNYTAPELKEMGFDLEVERYLLKTDYTPTQLVKLIKERLEGKTKNS
ncbi:MAG: response regulator [Methanosarcinales archaeon]